MGEEVRVERDFMLLMQEKRKAMPKGIKLCVGCKDSPDGNRLFAVTMAANMLYRGQERVKTGGLHLQEGIKKELDPDFAKINEFLVFIEDFVAEAQKEFEAFKAEIDGKTKEEEKS